MYTDQLEYFLAIAEQGSFTEAAFYLSISQSSLSKHIRKLEEELDVRLIDRTKKQIELTQAGELFFKYAKTSLCAYNMLREQLLPYKTQTLIKVGSIDHLGKVGLTTPLSDFICQYPEGSMKIEIKKGHAQEVIRFLLDKRIDIAITAHIADPIRGVSNLDIFNLSDCVCSLLLHDTYHAVMAENHPLAERELLTWEDLQNEPLVLLAPENSVNKLIRDAFTCRGLNANIIFENDQPDTLLGLAERGLGITFLSDRIASSNYRIKRIPIQGALTRDTIIVSRRKELHVRPILRTFAEFIENYYSTNSYL